MLLPQKMFVSRTQPVNMFFQSELAGAQLIFFCLSSYSMILKPFFLVLQFFTLI